MKTFKTNSIKQAIYNVIDKRWRYPEKVKEKANNLREGWKNNSGMLKHISECEEYTLRGYKTWEENTLKYFNGRKERKNVKNG